MALGKPRSLHNRFTFIVEIDGVAHAGFTKVSGLKVVLEKVSHREGGSLFPQKTPGLADIEDITLERGMALDHDFADWMSQTANSVTGRGDPSPAYERNLDIVVQDRDGSERVRFRGLRCWLKEWGPGDLDAATSEKMIEQVVIVIGELQIVSMAAAA